MAHVRVSCGLHMTYTRDHTAIAQHKAPSYTALCMAPYMGYV